MRAEDRLDRGAPGGGAAATQARRTVATFDLLELREAEAAVDRLSDRSSGSTRRPASWPGRPGTPRPGPFFADLAGVVDVPWDIAVGGDLVYPGVEGRGTLRSRPINAYLGRLHAAAGDRDAVPAAPTWADHAS